VAGLLSLVVRHRGPRRARVRAPSNVAGRAQSWCGVVRGWARVGCGVVGGAVVRACTMWWAAVVRACAWCWWRAQVQRGARSCGFAVGGVAAARGFSAAHELVCRRACLEHARPRSAFTARRRPNQALHRTRPRLLFPVACRLVSVAHWSRGRAGELGRSAASATHARSSRAVEGDWVREGARWLASPRPARARQWPRGAAGRACANRASCVAWKRVCSAAEAEPVAAADPATRIGWDRLLALV
jgi:hypothetical protein